MKKCLNISFALENGGFIQATPTFFTDLKSLENCSVFLLSSEAQQSN
jgi:hypothetical protein